jgi:PAS domain S-box-containing protein
MLFNNFISKIANKLPLRFVLVVPFVLQLMVVISLIGWLSFQNGKEAIDDIAAQLRSEITAHIQDRVKAFLSVPYFINSLNQAGIEHGELQLTDTDSMARHFWHQIKLFTEMTYISYSNEQGDIVSANRDLYSKQLKTLLANAATQHAHNHYATDEQGYRTQLLQSVPGFNASKRPWYQAIAKAGKPVWYPVYKYFSYDSLGVGLGIPIYTKEGTLQGVLTADIALVQIGEFLHSLTIGKTGKAFVIEPDGMLIATSDLEKPYVLAADKTATRVKAVDSRTPLIQLSAQYLATQFNNHFDQLTDTQQLDFKINEDRYFLQVTPLHYEGDLNWLIVVAIPESDFMEQINANAHLLIWLSLVAFVIAIGVGLLTARWIIQPILRINTVAKTLANGQWEQTLPTDRTDELGQLACSFNQMARELKDSFQMVAANEEKLRQFLEAMPVGVAVHSADGSLCYVNKKAVQLLGQGIVPYATAEELTKVYQVYVAGTRQIYPPEQQPALRALFGEMTSVENMEIHQPDKIIPIEVWGTPVFNNNGEIIYAIVAFQDITERRQAEAKHAQAHRAEQARMAADAANRAKSEFLASMSHELRTPLNGILGYAQILQRDSTFTEKQQSGLMIIQQSGEHLLTLINDILDLSKIEAGKLELVLKDFHLPAFLQGVVELFRLRAAQKELAFMYEPLSSLPEGIRADEQRLRQVLLNLLSNAIKFTHQGHVTLAVGYQTHSQLGQLYFQVEDSGIGIAEEDLEKVFRPFQQVGNYSHTVEGTGLGLPITQKLVNLMGGQLQVKSELGKGSAFDFEIEVQEVVPAAPTRTTQAKRIIGYQGESRQILVVDDKWQNRSLLMDLLQPLGFILAEAKTGEEALQLARKSPPEAILMDSHMPTMDGLECTRQIRQDPHLKDTVIIAISANVFADYQQACLGAGCQAFLPKPVNLDELLEVLATRLCLQWNYDETESTALTSPTDELLLGPSPQQAKELLDLIMIGDLQGIIDYAGQLEQLDAQLQPFAKQVCQLTESFQDVKLEQLVKLYVRE